MNQEKGRRKNASRVQHDNHVLESLSHKRPVPGFMVRQRPRLKLTRHSSFCDISTKVSTFAPATDEPAICFASTFLPAASHHTSSLTGRSIDIWAGLLASGSFDLPRLPESPSASDFSGIMRLLSPVTAAGPRRNFTVFPILQTKTIRLTPMSSTACYERLGRSQSGKGIGEFVLSLRDKQPLKPATFVKVAGFRFVNPVDDQPD